MVVRRITIVGAATTSLLLLGLGAPAQADSTVRAKLQEANGSGVSGTAMLTAGDDGSLTAVIKADGLVPGQPHAQHIHGSVGGEHFMCPTMDSDTDGDGVLTNEEASGEYGTIFVALTTSGDSSPTSGLALDRMPVADSSGSINYERTFQAGDLPKGLVDNLSQVHVVQHGIDVNDNQKYDLAGLGESTFAKNLGAPGVPEEATNPASCGVVTGAMAPTAPHGGVETGGEPAIGVNAPLAALGGLLVALSGTFLLRWRSRRG
jgi:hypothetical protein